MSIFNISKDKLVELTSKAFSIGISAFKYGDNLNEEFVFNIALSKFDNITIDYETGPDKEIAYVRADRQGLSMYFNPAKALEVNEYLFANEKDEGIKEEKMLAILRAIIKHELLHVMLKHLVKFPKRDNPILTNIVADAIVNNFITEFKYFENEIYAVTPETITHIDPFSTSEPVSLEDISEPVFGKKFDEHTNAFPIIVRSKFSEYKYFNFEQYYDFIAQNMNYIFFKIIKCGNNGSFGLDRIDTQAFGDITPVDSDEIDPQIMYELESLVNEISEKSRGTNLGRFIENVYIPSNRKEAISWKRVLRYYIQNGGDITKRYSIKRYDRRYDRPPGKRMSYKGRLIRVLIDSSWSIETKDLEIFLSEVYILAKKYGYKIDGYFYDANLQNHFTERDIKRRNVKVIGRGGTSLRHALRNLPENKKAKITVVLTDGYDDIPKRKDFNSDKVIFIFNKYHNARFEKEVSKWAIVSVFK